ncbi:hypothetical protein T484DRAFT_1596715, partial [Baffinella frigidus]
ENDNVIETEMTEQSAWFHIMEAKTGLMKFRMPYVNPAYLASKTQNYEYMDGTVYLPIWGRRSTTECRLIVK